MTLGNSEFQEYAGRIDRLVQHVATLKDEEARTTALELLQSVMDLHGAVVSHIVQVLGESESGRASLAKLGRDPLVCGMLVLYGVHPLPLDERVTRGIENARSQIRKHGGAVELIGISDFIVHVKLQSSGHGCGSSLDALLDTLRQSILEVAPEVVDVVVEGAPAVVTGFVPVNLIQPATKEEKNYEESAA